MLLNSPSVSLIRSLTLQTYLFDFTRMLIMENTKQRVYQFLLHQQQQQQQQLTLSS